MGGKVLKVPMPEQTVLVGEISGVFGVKGWVKVFAYTQKREDICTLRPWWGCREPDGWQRFPLLEARVHGKRVIARLAGVSDPDQAQAWIGCRIGIARCDMPKPDAGHYYWQDLLGMMVVQLDGKAIGRVLALYDTAANDVLSVDCGTGKEPVLVPFVMGAVVQDVDLVQRRITVDWCLDED